MGNVTKEIRGKPGETLTWNPVLGGGLVIQGRVMDKQGNPLQDWLVRSKSAKGKKDRVRTGADGAFAISQCEDSPHVLSLYEYDKCPNFVLQRRVDVRPGQRDVTFRAPMAQRPTARIKGRVQDPRGHPIEDAYVRVMPLSTKSGPSLDTGSGDGRFNGGPYPPGKYQIRVRRTDYPTLDLGMHELRQETVLDLGTVILAKPAFVSGTLKDSDSKNVKFGMIQILDSRGVKVPGMCMVVNGRFRPKSLQPGHYSVRASAAGISVVQSPVFELKPEQELELQLKAVPGVVQNFLLIPPPTPGPNYVKVTWKDAKRQPLWTEILPMKGQNPTPFEKRLAPGGYRIEVHHRDKLLATRDFSVPSGTEKPPRLEIQMK